MSPLYAVVPAAAAVVPAVAAVGVEAGVELADQDSQPVLPYTCRSQLC